MSEVAYRENESPTAFPEKAVAPKRADIPPGEPKKNEPRPVTDHLNGALALAGLVSFYAHECYGRNLIEAIKSQNDSSLAGLAVLIVVAVAYIGSWWRR